MADGKVIIETGLDITGATKDLNNLGSKIKSSAQNSTRQLDKETKNLNTDLNKVGKTGAKSMQQISSGADKSTKSISGLKGSLGKIAGILAAGFSIQSIIRLGKQSLDLASDLTEVQNVVDTAFGSMSQKMEDFANTAIETYGISKLTAKNIGSTYTAMARGMGQSLDQATNKALEMTGRVADIASFYNLSIDRANTIGRAVYSGETEPLKQIGVIMTEDQLAAYALANGYDTLYKNMNAAQKLEVRQAYFLSQTKLAAGDFVKTQDSWANQTKILSERWKEFLSVFGTGLIQILTPALKALNQLVSAMTSALTAFNKFLGINTEVSSTGSAGIADIADDMGAVTDNTEKATKAQKKFLGNFDEINNVQQQDSSATSAMNTGISGMNADVTGVKSLDNTVNKLIDFQKLLRQVQNFISTRFGKNLDSIWDGFIYNTKALKSILFNIFKDSSTLVSPLLDYLEGPFIEAINAWILNIGVALNGLYAIFNNVLDGLWTNIIFPISTSWVTSILPVITELITNILDILTNIFSKMSILIINIWNAGIIPILQLVGKIFTDTMSVLSKSWKTYGKPLFDMITDTVNGLFKMVENLWTSCIQPIISNIMVYLEQLWSNYINPIIEDALTIINELGLIILNIWNVILIPLIDWLVRIFGRAFSTVFEGLLAVIKPIINSILDIIKNLMTILKGLIQFISGAFSMDWQKCWTGIKNVFKGVWDSLVGIAKSPINLIIGLINGLIKAVQSAVNFIADAVNSLSFTVPNWVPGIGGSNFGFNLPIVNLKTIPYLATGAVLPPNKPFMAMLGDQRNGTNIEAPLDTIKQALDEVLSGRETDSGDIIVQIDGREVFRAIRQQDKDYRNRNGSSAFAY